MQVINNQSNQKHKGLLNALVITRMAFIPCIIVFMMLDFYGAFGITLYWIPDFTHKFPDGQFANFSHTTLYMLLAATLFLLSCVSYIVELNLVKKHKAYSNFHNFWAKIIFKVLVDGVLIAMAWHDFTIVVWPTIMVAIDITMIAIKNHALKNKLTISTNKCMNWTNLWSIISICWILFIFNSMEYLDHLIMWWVVQNIFVYVMVVFGILSCAQYGRAYKKAKNGKSKN